MEVGVIVKKLVFSGLASAGAVLAGILGAGTANAAPDVVGMTYDDAAQEVRNSGGQTVVATRVGDRMDQGDCIVTTALDQSFLRIDSSGSHVSVALNCAGEYATATNSGLSVAHPLGREFKEADDAAEARKRAQQQAKQAEEQVLADVSTPDY
ncbi:Uncharacterised protein [Mycolicibacterium phlei]|jgi:hypothetical protein|uniref:DUF5666 domain-containing protein n=1 Tax=Mycolicibacterium phlei DSM 43239 = CCUG 21000 TaxID=1226750 RepID=A0A5N5UVG8_MYCPH|nr:PASTA domain-containing protein [Mycolicibacterium phlei]VEG07694.1 Uncharacterised protein [Mycobacteroides chelonae]AMO59565.1 hypothetical protein MPHLCCUG_00728 [Mycolicibacterium phlei]KAB7753398.1 hypothetical protein MPHL21000_19330 [Mycolicibacterium phlei DSM 43239 = CCUG 21000]KXW62301.1 hypothetical protein MPHL43239_18395 [Mycolicibacterium phlei DSM 43239 = CCUG 21000]KXW69689.1 hypothetical protein MPHL43072_03310 [Mycolicibacterium phlei DSM 43072]